MTRPPNKRRSAPDEKPAEPVDVIDGIPDRSAKRSWWKYTLLAMIFAVWLGFLIYCCLAGNVEQ